MKYREGNRMPEESIVNEETDFEDEFNKLAEAKLNDAPLEDPKLADEPNEPDVIKDNDGIPGDEGNPKDKPDEEIDMFSGLSEGAKAHFKKIEKENSRLNHRFNSDDGRVRAYQKQNSELKNQVDELSNADMPTKIDIAEAMKGGSESWNKFAEDYPEIAEIFDNRAAQTGEAIQEAVDQALAPVKEQYASTRQREIEAQDTTSKQVVSKEFENWDTFIDGSEGKEEFSNWMDMQPPGIRSLADSVEPEDAIALIGMFDLNRVANGTQSLKKATPDGVENNADEQQMEADKLKERRKQQLNDGATVKSKSAKIDPGGKAGGEFTDYFDFYANKRERQKA